MNQLKLSKTTMQRKIMIHRMNPKSHLKSYPTLAPMSLTMMQILTGI